MAFETDGKIQTRADILERRFFGTHRLK
nr:unnamed protein product [Callosobruchus chinensis]